MTPTEAKIIAKNERFAKMSRKQQRIQIAKDVIESLGKRLIAKSGCYLKFNDSGTKCSVCALGALFSCATVLKGARPWATYSDKMVEELSPYFAKKELRVIEAAFEGWDENNSAHGNKKTAAFNEGVRGNKQRMIRVMENIIENNGKFKP